MEELTLKRKELQSLLRKNVAEEIADQCCEYFENHCYKLLYQKKEQTKKFFSDLRRRKVLKICLGTTLIIGGIVSFVVGIRTGEEMLKGIGLTLAQSGIHRITERNDGTFISSNNLGNFAKSNIDLQKYCNGTLTITLNPCFGTVLYPLQVRI